MHHTVVWQHSSNSNIKIVHNSIEHFLWNPSDFSSDVLVWLWIVFTNSVSPPHFWNRTLEYLRHNLPGGRLVLHQTDNPWSSYSQDLNPPNYFLRGYQKDRVCENNPQIRENIIRKKIGQIPQEMFNRVVDNFNVRVAAVLSYSSAVHGSYIVLKSIVKHYWF